MKIKKIKFKRRKYIFSPITLTLGILISWVVGIVVGITMNYIIERYVPFNTQIQYGLLVLAFVLGSACLGFPIALLITSKSAKIIDNLNETINKIAECDFNTSLPPISQNEQISMVVNNFNRMIKQLSSVSILKNDFISGFSHEFKTPIVSVKGYAELLKDNDNLTDEQKEYVKIIIEESERLSKLSEKTMLLAKLDSQSLIEDKKEFSLNGQIEDCILLLDNSLKEKNIELESDLINVNITSSPDLLKEVWINLLNNSIKYTNEGGKISVALKVKNGNAVVVVKDNGIGMTEEVKKHVFDKFFQVDNSHSQKGIGLGLSIVSRILELVNGAINCESVLNEGTTMTVVIPLN